MTSNLAPMDWDKYATVETGESPGFVDDDFWYGARANPKVDAMSRYVGGGGHGPGDDAYQKVVKETYKASGLNELKKPTELREILTEIEGPLLTYRLLNALTTLYRALPPVHRNVLARLDDPFVGKCIIVRAALETEPPQTLDIWHTYVSRCFSLAAALRHAVITRTHDYELTSIDTFPPTVKVSDAPDDDDTTSDEVHGLAATTEKSPTEKDDPAVDDKRETPWQSRRRDALERKELRRATDITIPEAKFAERPLTEKELASMKRQQKKHKQEEAAKKRLEKYQKRVTQQSQKNILSTEEEEERK